MKSEPMKKKPSDGATGEEDIGGSTPSKVSPKQVKMHQRGTKEISGDAQQKGEGKPDKMQKYKGKDDGTQKGEQNLLQWVIQMTKSENFVILKTTIVQQS